MKWSFDPCKRYRQDISLLASGVLTELERNEISNHLAACVDCRKYYEEIRAVTVPLANWEGSFADVYPTTAAQNRWARAIQAAGRPEPVRRVTPAAPLREWLRDVIWPCRRIWAGLAAVWLMILAGNLSLHEHPQAVMAKSSRVSQEMIMAIKDRQNILAELLADHSLPRDADRQKFFLPKPRTERVIILNA
jgi:anti-sigma factor RsiW